MDWSDAAAVSGSRVSRPARPGPLHLAPEQIELRSIPGTIDLRPTQPGDAAAVADLPICCNRTLLPYLPQLHSATEMRSWVADSLIPGQGVSLAMHRQRVVGMQALSRRDGHGWIDPLYLQR